MITGCHFYRIENDNIRLIDMVINQLVCTKKKNWSRFRLDIFS